MVKFKRLTEEQFKNRYPEAVETLDEEMDLGSMQFPDAPYGEVKIPGYGWFPCLFTDLIRQGATVATLEPGYFYSDEEGWETCPRNQKFEEVK